MFKKILLPASFTLLLFQLSSAQEEKYIGLFLYNFTKYFDWPIETKTGDFVINILGHESVANELKKVSNLKKVGTQDIIVKDLSDPSEIGKCQIMFVGFWHSRYLPDIIAKMGTDPCLIVTEKVGLLQQGAAINFLIKENEIKFELKKSNATSHKLKMDPRIAELAVHVED